jgi:hypothetical protein
MRVLRREGNFFIVEYVEIPSIFFFIEEIDGRKINLGYFGQAHGGKWIAQVGETRREFSDYRVALEWTWARRRYLNKDIYRQTFINFS